MELLSFLIFFALYAGAAFPSFGSDGAAELLAAAASNGVPPAPAQTLAWLAAKAALWLPFGNPAYRTNLLAAALMAGTVPMVAGLLAPLSPPKGWAPFVHEELEQDRWRATARWLTAFLWGLSPGPWRLALFLGPDTVGLFLSVMVLASAAADDGRRLPRTVFFAALAAGQWPPAVLLLPGIFLFRLAARDREPAPPLKGSRAAVLVFAALAGLAPAALVLLLSRAAPFMDNGGPDTWVSFLRQAFSLPPFFPPALATGRAAGLSAGVSVLIAAYTVPGVVLWVLGLTRLARERRPLLQASLSTAILFGPALFLWARPPVDPSSPAQAGVAGLAALALAAPFLWGFHRAGVRFPAARAGLALLLPLSLAARLPLAARDDRAARDRTENLLSSLPSGALLWNPAAAGGVFHARFLDARREDLRLARRPDALWGRSEFRRRYPSTAAPLLSPVRFFMQAAAESGPGNIFTDDPRRLPELDPGTGLASAGHYPEDALPVGTAYQFFPSESHRLVAPAAQLSVARVPLWAARPGDPMGLARARVDLARQFDHYGLSTDAEEECLAALTLDPLEPDARKRLAEADLARGEAARAVLHARAGLRRAPGRGDLEVLLGRAARMAGDRGAALDAFHAALAADPSLDETRRALAEILEEDGRWRAAAREWRFLLDRDPQERLYPWRLARAEASSGRMEKALSALREYMTFPLSPQEKAEAEALEDSLSKKKP